MRTISYFLACIGCLSALQLRINRLSAQENQALEESCGFTSHIDENDLQRYRRSANSRQTSRSEAPWAVLMRTQEKSLLLPNGTTVRTFGDCSGTLISRRHVLTAAHCFDKHSDFSNETLDIIDARIFIADCGLRCDNRYPTTSIKAKTIFLPNEYFISEKSHRSDIAIVELETEVSESLPDVQPACLGGFDVLAGTVVKLYGYGDSERGEEELSEVNNFLNLQTMETFALENCFYPVPIEPLEDEICTKNHRDVPRPIPLDGDSGSGLIKKKLNRNYVIAAYKGLEIIEAKGVPDIVVSEVEAYTRVAPHLFWICHITGICVENQSSYKLTAYQTVMTGEPTVHVNGSTLPVEAYPIFIKPAGTTQSTSQLVQFEN